MSFIHRAILIIDLCCERQVTNFHLAYLTILSEINYLRGFSLRKSPTKGFDSSDAFWQLTAAFISGNGLQSVCVCYMCKGDS